MYWINWNWKKLLWRNNAHLHDVYTNIEVIDTDIIKRRNEYYPYNKTHLELKSFFGEFLNKTKIDLSICYVIIKCITSMFGRFGWYILCLGACDMCLFVSRIWIFWKQIANEKSGSLYTLRDAGGRTRWFCCV